MFDCQDTCLNKVMNVSMKHGIQENPHHSGFLKLLSVLTLLIL